MVYETSWNTSISPKKVHTIKHTHNHGINEYGPSQPARPSPNMPTSIYKLYQIISKTLSMRQEIIYNSVGLYAWFHHMYLTIWWRVFQDWLTPWLKEQRSKRHITMRSREPHLTTLQWTWNIWLVVSTPLKNIGQLGWLSHILWKIKNVSQHQPDMIKPSNSRLDHTISICASWSSCVFVTCPCARTTVPGAAGTCKRMPWGQPSKKLHPVSASAIFANHLRISKD